MKLSDVFLYVYRLSWRKIPPIRGCSSFKVFFFVTRLQDCILKFKINSPDWNSYEAMWVERPARMCYVSDSNTACAGATNNLITLVNSTFTFSILSAHSYINFPAE